MLRHEFLLMLPANIGFDTAENEPFKIWDSLATCGNSFTDCFLSTFFGRPPAKLNEKAETENMLVQRVEFSKETYLYYPYVSQAG